jgi:hypothetical protein
LGDEISYENFEKNILLIKDSMRLNKDYLSIKDNIDMQLYKNQVVRLSDKVLLYDNKIREELKSLEESITVEKLFWAKHTSTSPS